MRSVTGFDDAAWAQSDEIIYGLPQCSPAVVGYASENAVLPIPETGEVPRMPAEELAKVTLSIAIKRVDQKSQPYQLAVEARNLKNVTAASELEIIGAAAAAATEAAEGKPPQALAFDAHPAHIWICFMLMGIMVAAAQTASFWKDCVAGPRRNLPMWVCRTLFYKNQAVFGCLDPPHVMKAGCKIRMD